MLFRDRKIIVTGGPTREWLDPVRFISNPSSGKMGVALADECFRRSKETVFICGPIDEKLIIDKKFRMISVETTADMLDAVKSEIGENAVLIMAAAPADYSPITKAEQKIKKNSQHITIELKKTPDILREISSLKQSGLINNLFTVGFAAETTNIEEYALVKLKEKKLDMICLNDVSRSGAGFGLDTNIISIFVKDGSRIDLPLLSKQEVAARIVDEIEARLPTYLLSQ